MQPMALLAAAVKPQSYGLVVPRGSPTLQQEAEVLIKALLPEARYLGTKQVDPYRPDHSRQAVRQLLSLDPEGSPAVSLVGAPLPMVLGAYDLCRECQYRAFYLNTQGGEIVDFSLPGSHTTRVRIGIERFLLLYGAKFKPSHPWPYSMGWRELASMAARLAHGGAATERLLRNYRGGDGEIDSADHSPKVRPLVEAMVEMGILVPKPGSKSRFQATDSAYHHWLRGIWLEHHVAAQAQDARDGRGEPLFDHVYQGLLVDLGGAERELDLVGLRAGSAVIGSSKTRGRLDKLDLDEVAAVGSHLGGDYSVRLFFTNLIRNKNSAWCSFDRQAELNRVVVVSGDELPRVAEILTRETLTPTFARK